jgi:hypothetical protein
VTLQLVVPPPAVPADGLLDRNRPSPRPTRAGRSAGSPECRPLSGRLDATGSAPQLRPVALGRWGSATPAPRPSGSIGIRSGRFCSSGRRPWTGSSGERSTVRRSHPARHPGQQKGHDRRSVMASELVGDTGFEPVTSSVSRKRAPTAPIALVVAEVETGFEPVYTALQAVASPLGHSTEVAPDVLWRHLRADDGTRTRDPHLGKVMRYQLRYVRMPPLFR